MRSFRLLFLATLLLSSISSPAQNKNTGAIKGKVSVERGSAAGVSVILRQGENEVARSSTDKHGDFSIANIPRGIYGVTFRKAGLATGSIDNLEVKAGKTRALHDIRLS